MTKPSNHPELLRAKREFGYREAERLRARGEHERSNLAKMYKAVEKLFTPPPVLRMATK